MTHGDAATHPHPPAGQETFRTVHEILEETARFIGDSSHGLRILAADSSIGQRDSLMLMTLAQIRSEAARNLRHIVESAPRDGEGTWLQYAPVFGNRDSLDQRVAAATSGQDAYAIVSEVDEKIETALRRSADSSEPARELLQQTEALVLELQRAGRTIVETATDI